MTEKRPNVSVVIPCYNLGDYLNEAVDSVKQQTYTNWEVIIVDDGSTDLKTQQVLRQIKKDNPEFKIEAQKNAGPSAARNNGIAKAVGKYIVCLDADDVLTPDYLLQTVAVLDAETDKVAFVTTWLQEFGERNDLWQTGDYNVVSLLVGNAVHVASMFKKTVWQEVGGYTEGATIQGYEDWDFWLKIVGKGYTWSTIHEPLFCYRIRQNSLLSTATSAHAAKYQFLLEAHAGLFKAHSKELILEFAQNLKNLHEAISQKNKAINELVLTVDNLQQNVAVLEEDIAVHYNSRIIRQAIRLRSVLVLVRKALNKVIGVTRKLRKLIPRPIVRMVRKVQRIVFAVTVTQVENETWPTKTPLVTIVSPFYNQAATAMETVQSILSQTYHHIEYIIVDDGSSPEEARMLDEIKDSRCSVLHLEQNLGKGSPAAARNEGIRRAKGKYIVCVDADDSLDRTYIEKCVILLETNPGLGLATSYIQNFGIDQTIISPEPYNPKRLIHNNMVHTAAMFTKKAWEKVGGFKSSIGYEDWEFWLGLAENGYWGKYIPEPLFNYRVAPSSRFVRDRLQHHQNLRMLRDLHPNYRQRIHALQNVRSRALVKIATTNALVNLGDPNFYPVTKNENILIAIPWMTFGGAETLILNFCKEIRTSYDLSFVTGLPSRHEWEYKFKEITPNIYHLPNLFEDEAMYIEFVSNYIITRAINTLHIIHTGFMFEMLPELKRRHPKLKVVVTMFNDRVEYFEQSIGFDEYIDAYTTDNALVANHYKEKVADKKDIRVIPNGINCYDEFSPALFNRDDERKELGISKSEMAIFFVGRLSEEKNPDVFIKVAEAVLSKHKDIKFFVIGDGPMKTQVEKMISSVNNPQLTYLGYQSEIAKYLSSADVFVLPSSIEGFPLSILEAMAMQVAVIASDVGAVAEVVESGKEGFVVTPGSAKEIETAILQLKADPKLLESVQKAARAKVEGKYSNTLLGQNYKKLYKQFSK